MKMRAKAILIGLLVFMVSFIATSQAELLHRYGFEAGAQDLVGRAPATLVGGPAIRDCAVQCDGMDDYVSLPAELIDINGLDEVTIEIWLTQPTTNQSYTMAVAFGNESLSRYLFISTSRDDEISRAGICIASDPNAPWVDEYGINGPEYHDGLEHVYALTVDDQVLAFYIDGELQGEIELNGMSLSQLSNDVAYLARSLYEGDPLLACTINEFRIYDTALSAASIGRHAQLGANTVVQLPLTVTSTEGGRVVTPGEGTFLCEPNEEVTLEAVADAGYTFLGWTGPSVDQGRVADPNAAVTEVWVDANASVCAVFSLRDVNVTGHMQLEVRGRLYREDPNDPLAQPGAHLLEALPDNVDTRVVQDLWLSAQSRLNLVDYYHDHPSRSYDVLYVRNLGLGSEAQLNLAGQRLYYLNLVGDPNQIVSQAVYAGELGRLDLTDPDAFARQVSTNNTPETHFVTVVEDANIADHPVLYLQPQGQSSARSKTYLGRFSQERVEVGFTYLFDSDDADQLLSVYLSDRAGLLDLDDPHYVLAGKFAPPESGRPGSYGSGRLASFTLNVDVGNLDPNQGFWLELMLGKVETTPFMVRTRAASKAGGTYIDRQSLCLRCPGICLDLTGDNQVTYEDYTLAVAGCGRAATADIPATSPVPCMDQGYGRNGSVDGSDLGSLSDLLSRGDLCSNLCGLGWVSSGTATTVTARSLRGIRSLSDSGAELLLLGQGSIFRGGHEFIGQDNLLCGFDSSGKYLKEETLPFIRGNIRLVRNTQAEVMVLNTLTGLCRMDGSVVLGPCQKAFQGSKIYIGLQSDGENLAGRPLLDAAFYGDELYVTPVVVVENDSTYLAAARLIWVDQDYEIQALYADPNDRDVTGQNPNLTGLRDLEVDPQGRLYLLNAHQQNASDVLWFFDAQGELLTRQFLDEVKDVNLVNPIGLHYDAASDRIYLAHGLNRTDDEENTSLVVGLSWGEQELRVTHRITIDNLQHVTGIASDGQGVLWITGLNLTETPEVLYPWETPYPVPDPRWVQVATAESGLIEVETQSLYGTMNINLPLSILWTGD